MKIGILTFHKADSYGAVLQAYALQTYLITQGHEVEIIDYSPSFLVDRYKVCGQFKVSKNPTLILRNLTFPLNIPLRYKRSKLFNKFRSDNFVLSSNKYHKPFNKNYDYDLYIIGSDQIWNPKISRGLDNIFWGNFKIKESARKITYAASSSYYDFNKEEKKEIDRKLKSFNCISVRETELKEYLSENFNIESHLVCDPTLLVERNIWDKIAAPQSVSKYLLVFFSNKKTLKIANIIARQRGLQVISIHTEVKNLPLKKNEKIDSPCDFVGLFKQADFVVCSSFHALSFSLIFNKEFCMVGSGTSNDSRALSMLDELGAKDRFILNSSDIDVALSKQIDFDKVNYKIGSFREVSRQYLKNAIKQ